MIKVIAFDFGGVLGSDADEWNTTFKKVLDKSGLTVSEMFNIWEKYWPTLKLGKGNIMDYWVEAAKKNGVTPKTLREIYNQSIRIDNDVLKIAKSLKRKYKLIILSNDTKDWMDAKIKRFKFDKIFDKVYSSANLGISKPNRKIFDYVLRDLKIKPQELIFIDNQENNYEAARDMEINTILFKSSIQLKKELSSLLPH